VTQGFITRQVDALTVRRLSVGGVPTSLLDLGFDRVGIDAGCAPPPPLSAACRAS
jgi:hypothetical protein